MDYETGPYISFTSAMLLEALQNGWEKLEFRRSLFRLVVTLPCGGVLHVNRFLPENRWWVLKIWLNPKGVFNYIKKIAGMLAGQTNGQMRICYSNLGLKAEIKVDMPQPKILVLEINKLLESER